MQNRDVAYALVQRHRDGETEVLLEQRPETITVMKGMWELPEIASSAASLPSDLKVRHAIMQTNYRVRICSLEHHQARDLRVGSGDLEWFAIDNLGTLPLTGLARKVMKHADLHTAARVGGTACKII